MRYQLLIILILLYRDIVTTLPSDPFCRENEMVLG